MKCNDSVITYVDYGYIKYNIASIMKERNISKNQITKKTGLHHQIIDRYITGSITRLDKEVLAKLCYVLNCTLDDIIIYVKPNN